MNLTDVFPPIYQFNVLAGTALKDFEKNKKLQVYKVDWNLEGDEFEETFAPGCFACGTFGETPDSLLHPSNDLGRVFQTPPLLARVASVLRDVLDESFRGGYWFYTRTCKYTVCRERALFVWFSDGPAEIRFSTPKWCGHAPVQSGQVLELPGDQGTITIIPASGKMGFGLFLWRYPPVEKIRLSVRYA